MRCLFVAACAAVLLVAISTPAQSAVVGIDFGSEFIKVASVKPGTPFHIVVDEQSKRKVPAVVAFDSGERHFGNGGIGLAMRKPKETYMWAHQLLGQTIDSEYVKQLQELGFPFDYVTTTRGGIGFKHKEKGEDTIYSVEEVIAMSLQHIIKIAEADAQQPVKDAVITCPPYWAQRERQALLDAAEIAGLNVLALVNENSAAAIQYGIDRKYTDNEVHRVMFYNMGSTSTKVSLAEYTGYTLKSGKHKNKTIGQFEVKSMSYDGTLGGHAFEQVLVDYIVTEVHAQFQKKNDKTDIRTIPRAMAKIRGAAEKAKVVLSANQDTPIFLGSLHNDIDIKMTITREHFYTLARSLLDRVTGPIKQVLDETGYSNEQLDAVVIIGGSVRIPGVQTEIKNFLKRDALSQNLNGDEAMAMGAVFRAANLSTAFQVRPFGMIDITPYPVGVRIGNLEGDDTVIPAENIAEGNNEEVDNGTTFSKRASLFKRYNRLGKRKTVQFSHTRDFSASLFFDSPKLLPQGMSAHIAYYNITGLTALMSNEKYTELLQTQKPRVAVSFALDASGLAAIVKAEATLEELIKVPVVKKVNTTNTVNVTANANATNATAEGEKAEDAAATSESTEEKKDESASASSASTEEKKEEEIEYTTKKKIHTIALKVVKVGSPGSIESFNNTDRLLSKATLERLRRADDLKKEIAFAKNTLESYIYATRQAVNDADIEPVSTEEQREAVRTALSGAEDWLYEQADDNAKVFKDKLQELKDLYEPIAFRFSELTDRVQAVNASYTMFNFTRTQMEEYKTKRPWVKEEDREKLLKMVEDVEQWLKEKEEAQSKLQAHEVPAFSSSTLYEKLRPIAKLSSDLMKLKKPLEKPKPKAKKPKKTTNGTDDSEIKFDSNDSAGTETGTGTEGENEQTKAEAETPTGEQTPTTDETVTNEQTETTQQNDAKKDEL